MAGGRAGARGGACAVLSSAGVCMQWATRELWCRACTAASRPCRHVISLNARTWNVYDWSGGGLPPWNGGGLHPLNADKWQATCRTV